MFPGQVSPVGHLLWQSPGEAPNEGQLRILRAELSQLNRDGGRLHTCGVQASHPRGAGGREGEEGRAGYLPPCWFEPVSLSA